MWFWLTLLFVVLFIALIRGAGNEQSHDTEYDRTDWDDDDDDEYMNQVMSSDSGCSGLP